MDSLEREEDEAMEDVFLQDDLGQTIAEHATRCHSLFHEYMVMPKIVPDPTIIDDQLARFSLWASNMDVYGPPNVSLDYRLRYSPIASDIIHQLLDVISDTLLSLKPIDDRPPQISSRKRQRIALYGDSEVNRKDDDNASDSESDLEPAEENILKITETIGGTVTRLYRLSNAVRKSAKANRARKIERYKDDEEANKAIDELRLYTRCYIEFRFPETPEALRSALVEANALRLRRLYYQRSHRRRIDLSIQRPKTTPAVVPLPEMTKSAPAVRFAPSALPKPATTSKMPTPSPAPAPATNATTARQTAVADLYAKSTTEVPRAKSVLVNNKLSFPPMPPTQQCPYCGVIVEFKNTARSLLWQNHVIGDLEPFICVFSHCLEGGHHEHGTGPPTFETSKAWSSHMQTAHGQTWECRAPAHNPIVFDQEIQYQEHSIKEHGVPEAHAGALSNAARRPAVDKVLECPFGDDFQHSENDEPSAVFSSEALQSHVAGHMKEIALLALQKLPSDDDEDAENVDSDQMLEDDGMAGAFGIARASMYSVLDDENLDFQDDDAERVLDDEDVGFRDDDAKAADGNVGNHEEDISERVSILDLDDKDDLGMTKLHHAVLVNNLALIESLVQSGTSVNSEDKYGQTPLHYAAERGFIECMQVLVKYGADSHILDMSGFTPFLWAVVAGQESATATLLSMGADASASGPGRKSALAWAASQGWLRTAKVLVDHGASLHKTQDTQRTLPLGEAAAAGNVSMVRLLLECGANPKHRDGGGWSAIHWAAAEGHSDIVHTLLKAGANPNVVSSDGSSPLHCAANGGHVSIVRLLLENEADPLKSKRYGWTTLHQAAFAGQSHVVQCLLEDDRVRSTASQQDQRGRSVLHLAVLSQDLATVRILLDKSVVSLPLTLVDNYNFTAERSLDRKPRGGILKHLKTFSEEKLLYYCQAVTGLRQAVNIGSVPLIKLLLRLGHEINGMNSIRRTALYYALKNDMLSIMDLLLDLGADPNILPAGRKSWEDFIRHGSVLQRLKQAGYREPGADGLEVKRQIRQAFREAESQPDQLEQDLLTEMVGEDSGSSHGPHRPSSPVSPASSTPSVGQGFSSRLRRSPSPTRETNDNERMHKSIYEDWLRRLRDGK